MARERNKEKPKDHEVDEEKEEYTFRQFLKEVTVAVIILIVILSSMYLYSGNWPPFVVVVSSSMQHGISESRIGTIDIGDLVFVKKGTSHNDIITWVEGKARGYSTYGNYGDVIVYRKNGGDEVPVIHRAIVWIEVNKTSLERFQSSRGFNYSLITYDVPSLGYWNVRKFVIHDFISYNRTDTKKVYDLVINLDPIISNFAKRHILPHSGFITKGDNNNGIDQISLSAESGGYVEPVILDWIIGVARGEIPWVGLLKMSVSGEINPNDPPAQNSWFMLVVVIIFIISLPVAIEAMVTVVYHAINKRKNSGSNSDGSGRNGPRKGGKGDKKTRTY